MARARQSRSEICPADPPCWTADHRGRCEPPSPRRFGRGPIDGAIQAIVVTRLALNLESARKMNAQCRNSAILPRIMSKHVRPPKAPKDIERIELKDALEERYLAYALSTIMHRALPDARDGLKPVHRRLLHVMRTLRLDPGTAFKKCAKIVGDVMGSFHPHGDQSIYDALVRLAQDFSSRYPLVDGQGNFGNIDGDSAAAYRYTEARMTEVARLLLDGLDEEYGRLPPQLRWHASRSPWSSPAPFRTFWPMARPASPSAWPPTFRPTTPPNCATPHCI